MAVYQVGVEFLGLVGKRNGPFRKRAVAVYRCDCGKTFIKQCNAPNTSCGCDTRRKRSESAKRRYSSRTVENRKSEEMVVNGLLTQVGVSFRAKVGSQIHRLAVFRCECGNRVIISRSCVRKGRKTCGCESRKAIGIRSLIHGNARRGKHTPEFRTWACMKNRCESPSHDKYEYYGGRGIKICERWQQFQNFLSDMGPRPHGMSIDRDDPDGNYEPSNCKWSTSIEQARNKRSAIVLKIKEETRLLVEWSEVDGAASCKQIRQRLRRGWTPEEAVFGKVQ